MLKNKSLRRIRLLLRQEWAENGKFLLYVLSGLTILFVVSMVMEQNKHWENITRNDQSYIAEQLAFEQFFSYTDSFYLWFYPGLTILLSLAFGAFRRRENGRWYLGLPASPAEKWISKSLLYFLAIPLVLMILYLLVGNIHLALLSTPGYEVRWLLPGDLKAGVRQPFHWAGFGVAGFFFLMAIWQPNYSWVKSIISVVVIGFLMKFLHESVVVGISGLPLNFDTNQIQKLGFSPEVWDLTPHEKSRIFGLAQVSFLLLGLMSILSSYFALREKQV